MTESSAQAIGRLISTRLPGLELDKEHEQMLRDGIVGGVVFFKSNAGNLKQVIELVDATSKASFHAPVLSIDEEGGAVQRFDDVLTPLPSAMALAAAKDAALALWQTASISGAQLATIGLNCVLAPVLDVFRNPFGSGISTRSYGSKPLEVAHCAGMVADAYIQSGIVPVGKHFPGHGSASLDSHFGLAVNDSETEDLWEFDISPFRECLKMESYLKKLPAILVGHIWLSHIDPEPLPASLSQRVIGGILRDFLDFDGLVMSDDMIMQAIRDKWSLEEGCLMALNAGIDHLLVCTSAEETKSVHKYLVKALEDGRLTEERVQKSIQRTDALFPRSGSRFHALPLKQPIDAAERFENLSAALPEWRTYMFDYSSKGIALLRGEMPSLKGKEWLVLAPAHERYPLGLAKYLQEKQGQSELKLTEKRYGLDPAPDEIESLGEFCRAKNCILLTFRACNNKGQAALSEKIESVAAETLHVACDSPFDAAIATSAKNYLATFDPSELAMEATAFLLLEERQPVGVCPVDLSLYGRKGAQIGNIV
jgi:beta-N-acetylhexosaminidase